MRRVLIHPVAFFDWIHTDLACFRHSQLFACRLFHPKSLLWHVLLGHFHALRLSSVGSGSEVLFLHLVEIISNQCRHVSPWPKAHRLHLSVDIQLTWIVLESIQHRSERLSTLPLP